MHTRVKHGVVGVSVRLSPKPPQREKKKNAWQSPLFYGRVKPLSPFFFVPHGTVTHTHAKQNPTVIKQTNKKLCRNERPALQHS